MEITGEVLGMARIGLDMDRSELADKLGVSLRTVANWEKNGVPPHRTSLVMAKIGLHVVAAQKNIDYQAWLQSPAGKQRQEEDYQQHVASGALGETKRDYQPVHRQAHSNDLLAMFTTETLLDEVSRRVAELEANQKEDVVDLLTAQPRGVDPDYSNMSEQDAKDYGLAANLGEPDIEHDELPHEP